MRYELLAAAVLLTFATQRLAAQRAGDRPVHTRVAVGFAAQDRDYRASLGPVLHVGVGGQLVPRLGWDVMVTGSRFGRADLVYVPCQPSGPCIERLDGAVALVSGGAEVRWGEAARPSAYIIGGGGVTRMFHDGAATDGTYGQVTGGLGWRLASTSSHPFFEVRFTKYLSAREPMSSWSAPILLGMRF